MNRITQPSPIVTRASDVVIGDMQIGALEGDGERERERERERENVEKINK